MKIMIVKYQHKRLSNISMRSKGEEMKKRLSLSLLVLGSVLYADISQQEFLYKDPRIVGMGSANTAVGGYSTAVFYNPAGLINIKKSHGVEVELLGISVAGSKGIQDFSNDIDDAGDDDEKMVDAIEKHSGESFSMDVSNYTSISYHTENDLALSFGILAAAEANLIPHARSGSNGLLEVHGRSYGGLIGGVAQKFDNVLGSNLTVGISGKVVKQNSYEVGLDAAEVLEHKDDLSTYLKDTYEVSNTGFGVDLGLLYEVPMLSTWHPTLGFSVMNIGTLNFDDVYGAQPMTINAGFSVAPDVSFIDSLVLSLDYVDMLNAQQARIRNYNPNRSQDQYDNADIEYDVMQHVRAGVSLGLVDNSWFMMTLMGGWYQGAYTAGLDTQLTIIKLQVATYQEQIGSVVGQLEDRRYVVGLGIGW